MPAACVKGGSVRGSCALAAEALAATKLGVNARLHAATTLRDGALVTLCVVPLDAGVVTSVTRARDSLAESVLA